MMARPHGVYRAPRHGLAVESRAAELPGSVASAHAGAAWAASALLRSPRPPDANRARARRLCRRGSGGVWRLGLEFWIWQQPIAADLACGWPIEALNRGNSDVAAVAGTWRLGIW